MALPLRDIHERLQLGHPFLRLQVRKYIHRLPRVERPQIQVVIAPPLLGHKCAEQLANRVGAELLAAQTRLPGVYLKLAPVPALDAARA